MERSMSNLNQHHLMYNPYVFKTVFNPSHCSLLLNPVFNSFPRTTVSYFDLPTFLKNVTNKIA